MDGFPPFALGANPHREARLVIFQVLPGLTRTTPLRSVDARPFQVSRCDRMALVRDR